MPIKAGNDEIVVYGRKEEERSQAEAGRIVAENTRAAAEVLREAAKAAAEAAAEAANEAAEKANEAATGGISKMIVNFEEPEDIELPESGETVDTLFGKMKKWLGNLSSGAGSSLLGHLFSPGRVLASNENGRVTESKVSVADLANLSGTTGNLQEQITQLNGKLLKVKSFTITTGYASANVANGTFATGLEGKTIICAIAQTSDLTSNVGFPYSIGIGANTRNAQVTLYSYSRWTTENATIKMVVHVFYTD